MVIFPYNKIFNGTQWGNWYAVVRSGRSGIKRETFPHYTPDFQGTVGGFMHTLVSGKALRLFLLLLNLRS